MKKFDVTSIIKSMLFAFLVVGSFNYSYAQVDVAATAGIPAGTYTTLKGAFDAINAGTHQGDIAISISANTTETAPAVLNSSGAGSALYTNIIISPSADGVTISGSTTTGRGLIELKGADNVTINGDNPLTPGTNRNLTITNTASNTTTLTSVIRIANAATVVTSSDNISILNCILNGSATGRNIATATSTSASENNTFVIYAGGNGGATAIDSPTALTSVTTNTAASGTTINNLTISNNQINAAARAIVFNGAAASVSSNITITQNLIGDQTVLTGLPPYTTPSTTVYTKGIFVSGATSLTISNNSIKNILSFVATAMNAIELNSAIGTGAGVVTIANNTITGVVNHSSSAANGIILSSCTVPYTISGNAVSSIQTTGSASVTGISIGASAPSGLIDRNTLNYIYARSTGGYAARGILLNGGSNITVQNNMISDLNAVNNNSTTSTTFAIKGIAVTAGTGHKIYHNSINLFGPMLGASTAADNTTCLMISSATYTGIDVRNNIFSNKMSGAAATVHACVQLPSGATSAMNLLINNNAYYIGSNANNFVGILSGTFNSYATLPSFLAYTSTLNGAGTNDNESYSSSNAAPFVSDSDLHLSLVSSELSNVEQGGATGLVGVATDIDGNTRPDGATTFPDMGADEVTAPLACSGIPTAGSISGTNTICQGGSVVLTSNGIPAESGLSFQWSSSTTPGGPYTTTLGSALTQNTGALAATTYYIVTVTCANSGLSASTPEFAVNVNANPTIAVTPSSATYCNPGTAVSLSASGASTYAWTPSTGLSANIGASVAASPTTSTTYTVTGVDGNGCFGSTTVAIAVNNAPVISSVTATPANVCSGSNSQLQVNANIAYNQTAAAYSFAGSTGTYTAITGTTSTAAGDDGTQGSIPIGFTFNYNGNTFTTFAINTNGGIQLGSAAFSTLTNSLAGNANTIMPLWDDNNATGGNIQYSTTGTAPNRVLTVQWTGLHIGGSGSSTNPTIDMQVNLYETTGVIEFIYGNTSAALVSTTASIGISGAVGNYLSVTPLSPASSSTVSSATENNNISSAVNFPSGTIYTFTPPAAPVLTYLWSPSLNLSSDAIANPVASGLTSPETYTVNVSAPNGCSTTGTVSVTINPLPSAPTTTNSTQCGAQIPTATVASTSGLSNPTFVWYDAPVGGTAMQTSTSTTFTSVVSSTTTFYVSELNTATGCESTLTPVTITVASADLIQASIDLPSICIGQSVNLTVANLNPTPLQSYAYTWSSTAGNGLVSTTGSAVVATPTIPGTYIFDVNGVDGGCNAVSSVTLTVNPFTTTLAGINVSCFNAGDGSFSLTGSTCGTAPYSYSVDGGAFGPIPTNLVPGTYSVVTRDANLYTTAPQTIVITQPNAVMQPEGISNVSICQGSPSANIVVPATATISVPVTFGLATQPAVIGTSTIPTTVAGNPNIIASATLPALPAGATITSVNFTMNGLTPTGFSWASDVYFGFSGAYSVNYANGLGAPGATTAFNFTRDYTGGTYNPAGGTVELNYYDRYDDNAGSECTFPIGAAVGTLTIVYSVPNPTVNWYDAPSAGTLIGTGTPFETVGTSVLPNTNTPGVYNFYAAGVNGICESATRTLVTVTVNALPVVNAGADQTVCEGTAVTLNGTVAGGTWSGPVAVTNGTAFTPPAGVHTFTYSVTNVAGCTSTDDVVVTVNTVPVANAGADQTVCEGTAVTLNGTVAGGTWSGPVAVTNGTAFTPPVGVHTFTYSVTNVAGCTSTDNVIVTVNALPVVNAGSDQTICEGEAVTLTGSPVAGTWSGPVAVTDGVAFNPPAGVHTFTYSFTNGAGCTSTDDVVVTVNTLPVVDAGANQTICEGEAVTLTGSPVAGTWSGPVAVTDGVAFNPPAGVHTFTYSFTNGAGCTSTDDVVVTVNTLPVVDAGADQTICEGEAVTLTGSPVAGTWSGPVAVTDGVAFNPPAGVHTFTYSFTNGAGCTSTDDVVVTVNTLPVVDAGADQTICEGEAVTLTGSPVAGTWSGPVAVTDGVAFNPPAGVHTFTYSFTNGAGCTSTDDVIVTVNALPVVDAGADQTICEGEAVTLTGSPVAGTWSGPVAVTDGVAFNPPAGVHTFTYSFTNGAGCTSTDDVVVTVNTLPTVTATDNGDGTITASTGTTYQWIDCATNLPIAGATAQTYTVTANGSYAVIVNNGTCEDTSDCVVIDYIGIKEVSQDMISVFPNPTRDFVTVNMTAVRATIEVVDAQGKILQTSIVENGETVSLASYETGMYIFRITTENGTSIHRISKN